MRTMTLESLFVTPDCAMHLQPPETVRDHGYLFRTTREKMKHIFPIERVYDLVN